MQTSLKLRLFGAFASLIALLLLITSTASYGKTAFADSSVREITVFSWEDYIDEGYESADEASDVLRSIFKDEELQTSVLEQFEEETGIKVNYYSFATSEEMYNELIKDPSAVDLICPSEYMIMKMRDEGLIQPYTAPENYINYASPYIKNVFESIGLNTEDGKTYAAGYMWGTMGLIYNAEKYEDADFNHWSNLFDQKFKGKLTIKDSLRDSYIMALAIVYEEELALLKTKLEGGTINETEYKSRLAEIFNDTEKETVDKVGDELIKLKNNLYGFEVDAGKNDLLTGKIDVNFAWSGDAVFSMGEGDSVGVELRYVVPEEGSNVWFDGWVMTTGADVESATEFINFVSSPKIAIRNMDYIGYTSCIGGDELFDYVMANFNEEEGEYSTDLSYFFGPSCTTGKYVVKTTETNRHLYAQYADEETILRCAVMDNFSNEDLELVNEMWNKVKLITLSNLAIILIVLAIVVVIVGAAIYKYRDVIFAKKISSEQTKPRRKNCKVIKIENIK